MATKYGVNAKLYFDAAGVAHETWTEVSKLLGNEVTWTLEKRKQELIPRNLRGWKATIAKLKVTAFEFKLPVDHADAAYLAFEQAHLNRSAIGIAIMDGDITVAANEGLKGDFKVFKFDRSEPVDGIQTVSISLKPCISDTNVAWYTVPA